MKFVNLIAVALLLAASIVGSGYSVSAFSATPSNLPNEKTVGMITYVSGGVGIDEASAMKREQVNFPLTMEFVAHTNQKDELITNVAVTVKDYNDKIVLQTMSDGPYLYARLPDGTYVITAEVKGLPKLKIVNIAAQKSDHVIFEW
jgi:hypothetical protein